MANNLQKRSMRIAGHRTSLALEVEFWDQLEIEARAMAKSLPVLIAEIDDARVKENRRTGNDASLASAVRVYLLKRAAA